MLSSPMLTATVITRREQLAAYHDERGLEFARAVVRGKLNNQANLLKYFAKYLRASGAEILPRMEACIGALEAARRDAARVPGGVIDEARQGFLAIEGRSGKTYWQGVRLLLQDRVPFEGREHRGATDQVNAALNYGYGILYAQVWGAIMNAGLEPFAGFLHVDRPGKPSLVLDLIEEFRQPLVDRPVIAAFNKGTQLAMRDGLLDEGSRRQVAQSVIERLDAEVPFRGKQYRLRSVIQMQARAVASFLRRDGTYRPYSWKW
jgi:CRISPR-associated protein Cas1